MTPKRKAQEAFGASRGHLSAFAAAKLAKREATSSPAGPLVPDKQVTYDDLTATLDIDAGPYDSDPSAIPESLRAVSSGDASSRTSSRPVPGQLSTIVPAHVNEPDDATLVLSLFNGETATIVGEYDLLVLNGVVTICGSVLRPNSGPQRVYAPSTHALPQIQSRQHESVVRISSVDSGLRRLEKLSPVFRNIWASSGKGGRSFLLLRSTTDDVLERSLSPIDVSAPIDTVLRTLSAKTMVEPRKPRFMAIGAKASGKSTFNRILCNHLYSWTSTQTFHYLDLDPGQPEFGPPGQLSLVEVSAPLLGPPFTHPASKSSRDYKLLRSHTIAATSFKDDPDHYKACVLHLLEHVDSSYPLIVNSCGWVTGTGAAMTEQLINALQISDVVALEPLESALVDSLQQRGEAFSVYKIPRQPARPCSRTPAEHRAMQIMAYFHRRQPRNNGPPRWSGKPISRVRPWIVDFTGPEPGIFAIMSYGQHLHADYLGEVLDGSIVAVNVVDAPEAESLEEAVDASPEGLPFVTTDKQGISRTLDPAHSHCVGLALVRAIDAANKQIHLVTPLSESEVAALIGKKVVLVRGSFDPPAWAYLEDLYKDDGLSDDAQAVERPWVSRKALVGVEGAVWRLRHPPTANAVAGNR